LLSEDQIFLLYDEGSQTRDKLNKIQEIKNSLEIGYIYITNK